jgi:hypothetical protein
MKLPYFPQLNRKITTLLVAVILLTLATPSLQAQVVFANNLSEAFGSTHRTLNEYTGSQFTTDASASSFTFNSVTIGINSVLTAGGDYAVNLYSDAAGKPDVSLGSLSGDTPSAGGNYTYTSSGIALTALTPYWVVIESTGTGQYFQNMTASSSVSGGWGISTQVNYSPDSGTFWYLAGTAGHRPQLSISATAVPEPSTYAMLAGLGALGLVLTRRRRA